MLHVGPGVFPMEGTAMSSVAEVLQVSLRSQSCGSFHGSAWMHCTFPDYGITCLPREHVQAVPRKQRSHTDHLLITQETAKAEAKPRTTGKLNSKSQGSPETGLQ